jgi:hypothetical protein
MSESLGIMDVATDGTITATFQITDPQSVTNKSLQPRSTPDAASPVTRSWIVTVSLAQSPTKSDTCRWRGRAKGSAADASGRYFVARLLHVS